MKTAEEYEATIAYLKVALEKVKAMCEKGSKRIKDLERSAASAREIARVAMTHTGTRAMRVCVENTNVGLSIIVCDPAGNEPDTAARIAKMLDASLWAMCGVEFTGNPGTPVGSSE
jgi:aconitase B